MICNWARIDLEHFTAFSRSIDSFDLRHYCFLQVGVLGGNLLCFERTFHLILSFDAGSMNEESIVKDVELVVQKTKFETLSHFVRPSLPCESFIVERFLVSSNVDWLPVLIRMDSLANIKYIHSRLDWSFWPLLGLGDLVALRTNCLVEWNHSVVMEQSHQLSFIVRKRMIGLDLEYRVDEHSRRRSS